MITIKRGEKYMERLTMEYCGEYVPKELCSIDRLGNADDCDLCYEYCKATEDDGVDCRGCAINQCFNKLGEYEELEDKGKLLKLPCAVGDAVYAILPNDSYSTKAQINKIEIKPTIYGKMCYFIEPVSRIGRLYRYFENDFGKTVFLTPEEAEAALKNM